MLQLCNIRLCLNHPTVDHIIKFPSLFCHLTNDKTQTPPQPHQPTQTNTQTAPDRVSSELQLHKFRNKSGFVSMNAHSPDPTCAQVLIFSVTHPRHFGRKGVYNLKLIMKLTRFVAFIFLLTQVVVPFIRAAPQNRWEPPCNHTFKKRVLWRIWLSGQKKLAENLA